MWAYEHTVTTTATPEQAWALYSRPSAWPDWDAELEEVRYDGELTVGGRGRLKPRGGPWSSFTVTRVDDHRGFADVTRLPLARLVFEHTLEPVPGGTRLHHRVTISGPLSWLFARVVGGGMPTTTPVAMERLATLAEGRLDARA